MKVISPSSSYNVKKNVTQIQLSQLLMHASETSPIKTEYYMRDSKENMSQFSIESKNLVTVQKREANNSIATLNSSNKKIILYKTNKGYDKIKRDTYNRYK